MCLIGRVALTLTPLEPDAKCCLYPKVPGSLQAGLLVLQAAPAAPHRSSGNVAAASSYEHLAALPAPSGPSAPSGSASETMAVYSAQVRTSNTELPFLELTLLT